MIIYYRKNLLYYPFVTHLIFYMYYLTLSNSRNIRAYFLTFYTFLIDFRPQKKGEILFKEILPFFMLLK